MSAIFMAVEKIALGRAQSVYAGGVESMSNTPYYLQQARWGQRMGNADVVDGMYKDGFYCPCLKWSWAKPSSVFWRKSWASRARSKINTLTIAKKSRSRLAHQRLFGRNV